MNPPEVHVTCPHCWQVFTVAGPDPSGTPVTWDYDCEVCCRPMEITFTTEDGETVGEARRPED